MRHIASREIPIPSNLSLLHVEQEVMGDDTTAVEAVLSADSELMELRREEEHLHSIQGSTDRLKALYDRMEAIDAHSAESRARSILSGLSFTQEMQDKATKEFSGGWRMRIALARALFCRPDILLLVYAHSRDSRAESQANASNRNGIALCRPRDRDGDGVG